MSAHTAKGAPLDARRDERFWAKVDKDAPNGCWTWTGRLGKHGYAYFSLVVGGVWRWRPASRVGWLIVNGQWPEMSLLHSCDNPVCVNPAHLREGTQLDNMRDCRNRGRTCLGERNAQAKLTVAQVREIDALIACDIPPSLIASRFGLHKGTVSDIKCGVIWSHVTSRTKGRFRRGTDKTHCKRGHEFTERNTHLQAGTKHRRCRQCDREYARKRVRAA